MKTGKRERGEETGTEREGGKKNLIKPLWPKEDTDYDLTISRLTRDVTVFTCPER